MKKLAAIFGAAAIAVSSLFISACGTAEVEYTLSDDGTYYILSGVSGSAYALKTYDIPSIYDDGVNGSLPVKEIGDSAFMNCSSLYEITIPDTVTRIGDRAFTYNRLVELDIPQSVTYIGYAAFASSYVLEELTIPKTVKDLGPYAFAFCPSLRSVTVEAEIETLYIGTFMGMVANDNTGLYANTKLKKISLPSTVKSIHRESISGNFLTDIYFDGTSQEWQNIDVFYAEEQEDEEGETQVVTVHLDEKEKIEYFTVSNLVIHCTDADLEYYNGQILEKPV